jgi:hypothetical protein
MYTKWVISPVAEAVGRLISIHGTGGSWEGTEGEKKNKCYF